MELDILFSGEPENMSESVRDSLAHFALAIAAGELLIAECISTTTGQRVYSLNSVDKTEQGTMGRAFAWIFDEEPELTYKRYIAVGGIHPGERNDA